MSRSSMSFPCLGGDSSCRGAFECNPWIGVSRRELRVSHKLLLQLNPVIMYVTASALPFEENLLALSDELIIV